MSKSIKEHKEHKPKNFRLAIIDNQTHKQLWTVYFTKISLIATISSLVIVLSIIIYCIVAYTPIRTFIPGYPDAHSKRAAIQNAIKIDSLETAVYKWGLYAENLMRVLDGSDPMKIDSIVNAGMTARANETDMTAISKKDSLLREAVKKEEQFELSTKSQRDLPIDGQHFFTPIKGVISQEYDPVSHPYIDIAAAKGSSVKAILDGTVIYAGWNEDTGNTIQIQHEGDIVSIYSHNESLLKKAGDKVSAGTSIAIVGNTGKLSTGDHLHFELWYKGEAINPSDYINF